MYLQCNSSRFYNRHCSIVAEFSGPPICNLPSRCSGWQDEQTRAQHGGNPDRQMCSEVCEPVSFFFSWSEPSAACPKLQQLSPNDPQHTGLVNHGESSKLRRRKAWLAFRDREASRSWRSRHVICCVSTSQLVLTFRCILRLCMPAVTHSAMLFPEICQELKEVNAHI